MDLNYPSFISFYLDDITRSITVKFQRTVTNVGKGAAIYEAIVTAPEDYVVTVSPATLVFGKKYEIQSYNITLMGIGSENRKISFGELVWSEKNGNHKVRSPIVIFCSL